MKSEKKKEHYVNNKEFLAAMTEYKKLCVEAEESGEDKPPVSNYIGECFLKIANHLSYSPNFINYTFRDDMISDGIENCLQYLDNFIPEKSNNPFEFFHNLQQSDLSLHRAKDMNYYLSPTNDDVCQ